MNSKQQAEQQVRDIIANLEGLADSLRRVCLEGENCDYLTRHVLAFVSRDEWFEIGVAGLSALKCPSCGKLQMDIQNMSNDGICPACQKDGVE